MRGLEAVDPRQIGRFAVAARLGAGAMGAVYLARSAGGRPVAVKLVHPGLADDPAFRERFRREIAAARRIGGFWTPAVVDADPDAPAPWLATEFVPGPTLAEAVRIAGPLPEPTLRRLVAGLAEALAAIHAAGLVHRDVKPSNVLLATDGPRLIDFGIARALDHSGLTATGLVFGSPGYTSPEQVAGAAAGPASDIYSLGAVLVFAATGTGPFGTGSRTELLRRAALGRADLGATPTPIRPLVEACLHPDPDRRPKPAALLDDLRRDGEIPDQTGDWLPGPVQSMVTVRAATVADACPGRPSTLLYTAPARAHAGPVDAGVAVAHAGGGPPPDVGAPPGPAAAPPDPAAAPPDPAAAPPGPAAAPPGGPDPAARGARFAVDRRWAALRAVLCLLGLAWASGLGPGEQGERLVGFLAVVFCCVVLARTVLQLASLPPRVAVDGGGLGLVHRGRELRVPWRYITRIGVTGLPKDPWLVIWVSDVRCLGGVGFPEHRGGYRVYRVGAWRGRRAREAEARDLRAALSWHAGHQIDPHL